MPSTLPQTLRSIAARARRHQLSLIGAGVAFFGLLSLAPGLAVIVSVYGLVADPDDVSRQLDRLTSRMPEAAHQLVADQVQQVVRTSPGHLGVALVIALVVALWSGSSAIKQMLVALSAVYDVTETRTFLRLRAMAAALLLGATAFVVAAVLALTVVPRWAGERWGSPARARGGGGQMAAAGAGAAGGAGRDLPDRTRSSPTGVALVELGGGRGHACSGWSRRPPSPPGPPTSVPTTRPTAPWPRWWC